MKKRLLKPPREDKEILIVPFGHKIKSIYPKLNNILAAHQPGFFNPGVALKFLILKHLPHTKRILFVDTDRVDLSLNLETKNKNLFIPFIQGQVLFNCLNPPEKEWASFFQDLKEKLIKNAQAPKLTENISRFEELVLANRSKRLKDVLAESFLRFYGLKFNYSYLSDDLKSLDYKDFFSRIYKNHDSFQDIFNQALDGYKKEFKFRFKNFPFPKLEREELPFWIVKNKKRVKLFKKDAALEDFDKEIILPRASTLTIFLRLFRSQCFIHGVGGKNYEWVNDRIIENFFKKEPPAYLTVSGTFLPQGIKSRNFPFFFLNPGYLSRQLNGFLQKGA